MTTSGTSAFNMEFTELAEEAWERAGREMRTGYDLRTARRSMNLMTIEWANRGLNMWTIEEGSFTLTPGLPTYTLPVDTIDLLDHVIRTGGNQASIQADLSITRISVSTYATIPNKLTTGRPIQAWIQRLSGETNPTTASLASTITATATTIPFVLSSPGSPNLAASGYIQIENEVIYYGYITDNVEFGGCFRGQNNTAAVAHTVASPATGPAIYVPQLPAVTVWPAPDNSQTYQFVYWRMRRIQDAGTGIQTADMNFRFLPAVAAGLAYHIAMKVPELAQRVDMLKAAYMEQFDLAAGEDHEKASLRFVPRQMYIGGGTT
jgi:hypothetical protein